MSKYGNRKTTIDGITFDSAAEARRYSELKLLAAAGEISDLTLQPKFLLIEGFTYNGKKERPVYYIADFKYRDLDTSEWVVEDVKGARTEAYKLKRKLFLYKAGWRYRFNEVQA